MSHRTAPAASTWGPAAVMTVVVCAALTLGGTAGVVLFWASTTYDVDALAHTLALAAAVLTGVWTLISLTVQAWRRWRHARYLASQGLPADCDEENAQRLVAAKLRSDAVKTFGVTEQEWREFCDAHPLTQVGGAS